MKQLASSDKPDDIATLVYIYGFPLVSVMRTIDYTTNPNLPAGPGRGPLLRKLFILVHLLIVKVKI
jgi:hypothetical protein